MYNNFIYLDYAAATPLDARVHAAMEPYFSERFFNPSSAYEPARQVRRDFEAARAEIARVIGVKADEIIMTAGATESVNIAFHGVLSDGGHAVTNTMEHQAVLEAARAYAHTLVAPTPRGIVTADALRQAITDETRLISVAAANSELGTVQPLREIARMIEEIREERRARGIATPLYFHSDASQAAGLLDLGVARLGLDLLTLNAAKCYGPKQVGLLWSSSRIRLKPFIHGGGQEHGVRSGTENVAGAIGFAKALQLAEGKRKNESQRLAKLRDTLEKKLTAAFDDIQISGHPKSRLPGHLHVAWPGLDAERALFALELKGVLVATGSACAANKGTRSHVLNAVGMAPELADGSLRISLGRYTTEEDVAQAAEAIVEVVRKERTR